MEQNTVFELDKLEIVETIFEGSPEYNSLCLEWVEQSSDYWHSDNEVSIDISRRDAIKLIKVLNNHFGLKTEDVVL